MRPSVPQQAQTRATDCTPLTSSAADSCVLVLLLSIRQQHHRTTAKAPPHAACIVAALACLLASWPGASSSSLPTQQRNHQGPRRMSQPPNSTVAAFSASAPDDAVDDKGTLHVPAELQPAKSRPESPVNRKRADDDNSSSSQGHPHLDGFKDHSNSLPPSKKSKTSPPLLASPSLSANADTDVSAGGIIPTSFSSSGISSNLTHYRTSKEIAEDALSPQTSPVLEPAMPTPALASVSSIAMAYSGEKRYSPVSGDPVQSKARKLDEDDRRPSSPPFRPLSPRFQLQRQQEQQQQNQLQKASTIPAFDRTATAILDSLSKPGKTRWAT
ncbi:unnamed protein product [Mortierella alpina]